MILTIIIGIVAVIGWVCCYVNARRLKKWSDFCQHGRVAISYKGKVKLQAPLTEWVLWAKMLDKDKDSNGRVVYHMGGTAVAIAKSTIPRRSFFARPNKNNPRADRGGTGKQSKPVRGKYTATDETPKENHMNLVN